MHDFGGGHGFCIKRVPVANERCFLEWIGKALPDSVHKTYSTDQIASLSKLSIDMILAQ